MKPILSMLKIDIRLITRNPILLYMVVAPALLAFVYLAVLGNLGEGNLSFVVTEDMPQATLLGIERIGNVQIVENEEDLLRRVEGFDSVVGVRLKDSTYEIVLEGNEGEAFSEQVAMLVSRAVAGDIPDFVSQEVSSKGNVVLILTAVTLLLVALFLSGVVSGFNVILERESRTINALSISPLNFRTFLGARTITAMALALINMSLCVFIMGKSNYYGPFFLATFCSVFIIALITVGLGCTASNLISAIASIKLIMPVSLVLPMSSFFVPERFKMFYYWLPNYWQFEAIRSAWNGSINWGANIAMLVVGFVWLVMLGKLFRKQIGLR